MSRYDWTGSVKSMYVPVYIILQWAYFVFVTIVACFSFWASYHLFINHAIICSNFMSKFDSEILERVEIWNKKTYEWPEQWSSLSTF